MALNFKQTEDELTQLIQTNVNNERIYQLLHDIAFNYLYNVLKPGSIYYDYEMIACDVAADLFLRIKNGTRIEHYTSYISRILKLYYLKLYENNNWSVIIDSSNNANLEQQIQTCCMGKRNDDTAYIENILTGIYFGQFESIITETLQESKFKFVSSDRLNLELSILLTLTRKKPIYFRLKDDLKPFVQLTINKIFNKIKMNGVCDRDVYPVINPAVMNNDGTYIDELV